MNLPKMPFPYRDISSEEQRKFSQQKFIQFLRDIVFPYHPYYRKLFKEFGLHPEDMKSDEDIRQIPLTEKKDLAANPDQFILQPNFPEKRKHQETEEISSVLYRGYREQAEKEIFYRDIFGGERKEEERVYQAFLREWMPIHFQRSGGTSGLASWSCYTFNEIQRVYSKMGAMQYVIRGFEPYTKILNLFPGAPHLGIYQMLIAPLLDGWPSFNTFGGKATPTETSIELAARENFRAICSLPSYLTYWLETAMKMLADRRISPLETFEFAICAGEPMTPAYVARLKSQFEALGSRTRIIECMGSTELKSGFFECDEGTKLHLNPEFYYWEVLHPETREPVPWGEPGVLVFSHIDWRGTVLLRFWTGDYVTGGVVWDECPRCGLVGPRAVTPITRAAKDFVKIRGARVELLDLQTAVRKCREVESFQIRIGKEDEKDSFSRDWVKIYVAPRPGYSEEQVRIAVEERVRRDTEVTPNEIIFLTGKEVEEKLFARTGIKADWIVDERKI